MKLEKHLVQAYLDGQLSRRQLLRMAAAVGASVPVVALLAACGGDDDDAPATTSTTTTGGGAATATTAPTTAATATTSGGGAGTPSSTATTAATATTGGATGSGQPGGELRMSYANVVSDTLNQHVSNHTQSRMQARHVLDCLTFVDVATNEVTPWLAESWEISDDATEYTFTLKEGVVFHDGTDFNAEAVKANMDYTFDPDREHAFRWGILGGDKYDSTEVVDDYTVTITYKEPNGILLPNLSDGGAGIDSPKALEEYGDDYGSTALVGSGPFKFVEFIIKDHFTVEKNPDYQWGPPMAKHSGPAYLDTIIWREIVENATRAAAVQNNDIDVAHIVTSQAADFENSEDISLILVPKAGTTRMFLMNTAKAPVDDINVRTALAHAWDPEAFINLPVIAGIGRPAIGPLPANMVPGGDLSRLEEFTIPYDPDTANQMLDEAGWTMGSDGIREKDGMKLILDMVTTQATIPQVEPLDGMFSEVGAKLNIQAGDFNFWIDTVHAKNFHITLMSDSGYNATGLIEEFFYSGAAFADYGVDDPEIDAAIEEATTQPDPELRWEALFNAIELIMQDVPGIWGWEEDYVFIANKRVQDPGFNEVGYAWFYDTWIEE